MFGFDAHEAIVPAVMTVGTIAGAIYGYHLAGENVPTPDQLAATSSQLQAAQKSLGEVTNKNTCEYAVVSTATDYEDSNRVSLTANTLAQKLTDVCATNNAEADHISSIAVTQFNAVKSLTEQLKQQKDATQNETRNKIFLTVIFGAVGTGLGFAVGDVIEGGYY